MTEASAKTSSASLWYRLAVMIPPWLYLPVIYLLVLIFDYLGENLYGLLSMLAGAACLLPPFVGVLKGWIGNVGWCIAMLPPMIWLVVFLVSPS